MADQSIPRQAPVAGREDATRNVAGPSTVDNDASNKTPSGGTVGKKVGSGKQGDDKYFPASDAQTFRDLLIFEERLKQNAARLVKRRTKYQAFLVLLCAGIGISAYYVFVRPAAYQPLHYLNLSNLLITSTMLLLFFASGMYAERITAANKFVPQANRSLRSYNMYLNTRTAPRRSVLSPFSSSPPAPLGQTSPTHIPGERDAAQGANTRLVRAPSTSGGPGVARRMAIPSIPPTSNPRGELIFGSKVSPQFREGYERYRAAFERRRQEKLEERRMQGWRRWWIFGGHRRQRLDPERGGAQLEKTQSQSHSLRRNEHGSTRSTLPHHSKRQSPRVQRSRLRPETASAASGEASEASSRASSRRGSPSASPKMSARAPIPNFEPGAEAREDASEGIADVCDPSKPLRRSPRNSIAARADSSEGASEKSQEPSSDQAIAPDPTAVASRVDDRFDPEATLREPEIG